MLCLYNQLKISLYADSYKHACYTQKNITFSHPVTKTVLERHRDKVTITQPNKTNCYNVTEIPYLGHLTTTEPSPWQLCKLHLLSALLHVFKIELTEGRNYSNTSCTWTNILQKQCGELSCLFSCLLEWTAWASWVFISFLSGWLFLSYTSKI